MKSVVTILSFVLLFSSSISFAQDEAPNPEDLVGTWEIDLRPSPDADPYFQTFVVKKASDKTMVGSFYGSSFKKAIVNTLWSNATFAFSTSDKNNDYYHSGYLENGRLHGMTYCPDRDFAMRWTGVKK